MGFVGGEWFEVDDLGRAIEPAIVFRTGADEHDEATVRSAGGEHDAVA